MIFAVQVLRHLNDQLLLDTNTLARGTGWLHPLVVAFAVYGPVVFAAPLLAGMLIARRRPAPVLAAAGWAPIAALAAVAMNQPVVRLVHERRPYAAHPQLLVLAPRTADFSFPSDHAVMAGAAAAGLLLVSRRLGVLTAAAAVLLGFARVYVAAHYPGDIAAGLAFGAAVALFGWLLLRSPLTRVTRWLRHQPGVGLVFGATPIEPAAKRATGEGGR